MKKDLENLLCKFDKISDYSYERKKKYILDSFWFGDECYLDEDYFTLEISKILRSNTFTEYSAQVQESPLKFSISVPLQDIDKNILNIIKKYLRI